METEYRFRATEKMYNTSRNGGRFSTRTRDQMVGQQIGKVSGYLEHDLGVFKATDRTLQHIDQNVLSDGYSKQMAVMNLTEVYVYGLFDSFNFSSNLFDIIVPPGTPDHSLVWQQTADECFGSTTLMLKGNFVEGFRTFNILCERLKAVLGNNDCGMIIKFWRICLRLYKTALQLGSFSILQSFLQYLWGLAVIRYPGNHPVPDLLKVLCEVPVGELSSTLEIGYLRTIRCLQHRLGFGNAVVLSTWSNYLKTCDHQALSADDLLSQYRCVLQKAQNSFTHAGTRTIEILHGYTYAAYYNANDFALTWDLALDLVNRAESLLDVGHRPRWCLVTQGYALAAKLLCILSGPTGHKDQGSQLLRSVISRLERGDRECQTRAVMLTDTLEAKGIEGNYPITKSTSARDGVEIATMYG